MASLAYILEKSTVSMDSGVAFPDTSAVFAILAPCLRSLPSLVVQSYCLHVTGSNSALGLFPFVSEFLITQQEKLVLDPVGSPTSPHLVQVR